jgi:hypothetical protein
MEIEFNNILTVNYNVDNQADLINTFLVWKQKAADKKLMLITSNGKFEIHKAGIPINQQQPVIFDDLQDVMNYIENTVVKSYQEWLEECVKAYKKVYGTKAIEGIK